MHTYKVLYNLKFNAMRHLEHCFEQVRFEAQLQQHEIDSLAFLFAKYFDQQQLIDVQGLTFFTEFNKCIVEIKTRFDAQPNTDNVHNIKNIMSMFLRDEFVKQVPHFRMIIEYLKQYYNPISVPDVNMCEHCHINGKVSCLTCKCNYVSNAMSTLDSNMQNGWDIFLRAILGMVFMMFVILKTDFTSQPDVINENNLMTQMFVQFFYNLLCDKAYGLHTKHKMCEPLMKDCKQVIKLLSYKDRHRLLTILNEQCNSASTVHNAHKLLMPFKNFMIKMGQHTKIKKVNKVAATVLIGFFLRQYIESMPKNYLINMNGLLKDEHNNMHDEPCSAGEMELLNVCRYILKRYADKDVAVVVEKLKQIKIEIMKVLLFEKIVPETFIRRIIVDYQLDNEISLLLDLNHDCFDRR
ncbi:p48 [Condylorrhiza vestigialis mutiple nucleopolyhedrovirus]|uniref:p48 n=1 Tax=Condylorrhiza vestigialis mutiple nucleopolyhedrovirus TaxID=1592576 RepID=A0A0B4UM09_9ABAC|nr:p48 [Condylorrhiza vestigialis mutiple nucleopolyhedrovirus]AJD09213.1 p48 [Condylorrhiza vestigialis mutiple nucleopolyhedrovirus]